MFSGKLLLCMAKPYKFSSHGWWARTLINVFEAECQTYTGDAFETTEIYLSYLFLNSTVVNREKCTGWENCLAHKQSFSSIFSLTNFISKRPSKQVMSITCLQELGKPARALMVSFVLHLIAQILFPVLPLCLFPSKCLGHMYQCQLTESLLSESVDKLCSLFLSCLRMLNCVVVIKNHADMMQCVVVE